MKSFKLTQHEAPHVLEAEVQHKGIPCMTEDLISDTMDLGSEVGDNKHIIFTSNRQDVFNTGGDIELFLSAIDSGNRAMLLDYADTCIAAINYLNAGMYRGVYTIGCAEGDALGGGFESLLAMDLAIATAAARVGTPEALFGSFPGMGAVSFMKRKIGKQEAFGWVSEGRVVSAARAPKSLIGKITEPGETLNVALATVCDRQRRNTDVIYRAMSATNVVEYAELTAVVNIWVDHMMQLSEAHIRQMRVTLRAQQMKYGSGK